MNILNVCESLNIGNPSNSSILNDLINLGSDEVKFYLLKNPCLDRRTIKSILDNLTESQCFYIFCANNYSTISIKLIEECIKSENIHVKNHVINILLENIGHLNDRLLKKFYKFYNIIPIAFNKNELITEIFNKDVMIFYYYYYLKVDGFKLRTQMLKYLVHNFIDADTRWTHKFRFRYIVYEACEFSHLSNEQIEYLLSIKNSRISSKLAKNSYLPQQYIQLIIDEYFKSYDRLISASLCQNNNLSEDQLEMFLRGGRVSDFYHNKSFKGKRLEQALSTSNYLYEYCQLALNPNLNQEQIQFLINTNYYDVLILISSHKNLSKDQLEYLSTRNIPINRNLIRSPLLSHEQLYEIDNKINNDNDNDNINVINSIISLSQNPNLPIDLALKYIHYRPAVIKNILKEKENELYCKD